MAGIYEVTVAAWLDAIGRFSKLSKTQRERRQHEKIERGRGKQSAEDDDGNRAFDLTARAPLDAGEQRGVARLQPARERGFVWHRHPACGVGGHPARRVWLQAGSLLAPQAGSLCRKGEAKRGRDRQRDDERRKKPAGNPAHREHGNENENDGEGRVNDRAADLDRGIEHDAECRQRLRCMAVLAQAAQDIFHVDHRIIHNLADGDGEPAERHRVQRQTEPFQDDHRGEERERDRGAGDRRGAQMVEEKEEHHDHEHASEKQRKGDVARRGFNEVCRTEKIAVHELVRLHLDLELLHLAAKDRHFRHARHREEPLFHRPIGERPQLHQRALFRREPDRVNHARGRGERRHHRRLHALRQPAAQGGKPLRDRLPRAENIAPRTECDDDDGQP